MTATQMGLFMIFSRTDTQYNDTQHSSIISMECHYAECRIIIVMLIVSMLNVVS
jgi:hypothetical protein